MMTINCFDGLPDLYIDKSQNNTIMAPIKQY